MPRIGKLKQANCTIFGRIFLSHFVSSATSENEQMSSVASPLLLEPHVLAGYSN